MVTQGGIKMDRVFSGVLQTVIAAGIIAVAAEINRIDSRVAAMEERTKQMEDFRPNMNLLRLSQEEIKERLIRVEDNQHHKIIQ